MKNIEGTKSAWVPGSVVPLHCSLAGSAGAIALASWGNRGDNGAMKDA